MNFMAGFILQVSGSREKESFMLFTALLTKSYPSNQPVMGGLNGFYENSFPLLTRYTSIFMTLFKEHLPQLHAHFDEIDYPNLLWIHKWL